MQNWIVATLLCAACNCTFAANNEGLDEILQGFDDTAASSPTSDPLQEVLQGFETDAGDQETTRRLSSVDRAWQYHADTALDINYSFAHQAPAPGEPDYRGLSALRLQYEPDFDFRLNDQWTGFISAGVFYDLAYELNGRDQYTAEMLDVYESELELREAYVLGSSPNADVKIGRQIVVWGKSDNIRIVDILNPLDLREPGIVDIGDLRLPVTMTRLDYYFRPWSITTIAIQEIRFNKLPVYNSDYYPGTTPAPPENKPASSAENTEFAMAINGYFSGWDLSLNWAQVYDDQAYVEIMAPGELVQLHNRINMAGAAANVALGNWLLKTELAQLMGLRYTSTPGEEFQRLDALLGMEYSGFTDTMLSLEIANRHIFDYNSTMLSQTDYLHENNLQYALRYTGNFLHERLNVIFLSSLFGKQAEDGGFSRLSSEYDITDQFALTLGIIVYHDGDNPRLHAIADNDRIFFKLRFSY